MRAWIIIAGLAIATAIRPELNTDMPWAEKLVVLAAVGFGLAMDLTEFFRTKGDQ